MEFKVKVSGIEEEVNNGAFEQQVAVVTLARASKYDRRELGGAVNLAMPAEQAKRLVIGDVLTVTIAGAGTTQSNPMDPGAVIRAEVRRLIRINERTERTDDGERVGPNAETIASLLRVLAANCW